MIEFYYNYPVCPNCLTPVNNFSEIKLTNAKNQSYRCEKCNTHFHNRFIDENFKESLYWKVNLNKIEETYLSFLNNNEPGKYLITWPWEEVNFSPILACQYLIKNPENKVIIIDKLVKPTPEIFKTPSSNVLFDNLHYIKKVYLNSKYDENLIVPKKIYESRKKFYCEISLIKDHLRFYANMSQKKVTFIRDKIRIEVDFEENKFKQFRKNIEKRIKELYTDSAIYSIKNGHENKLPKRENDYGLLKLYFNIDEGIEDGVKLNNDFKKDYGTILPNISNLNKASEKIKSITVYEEAMLDNDLSEYNLIFLNDTMDHYKLIKFISKVNADITIFSRADLFFERSIIFNKGLEFNTFLNNAQNTVLLFSTFRDNRGLYKIGDETSVLNELNIIPHTWDFKEIIDQLKSSNHQLSLGSSNLNDVKTSTHIPIEYHVINSLDIIEDAFPLIMEFYNNNSQIKSFFINLIRTPLYLSGYFRDKKVFRKNNLSFESFFATIYNRDEELGIKLDEIFDSVYHYNERNTNPIADRIISLLTGFEFNLNDQIICVVDSYEVKGLKEIIELKIDNETILNHLHFSSWDKLDDFKFEKNSNYYIISTKTPYINFKLNNYDFKRIDFIGSSSVIDYLKIEMAKRLTDNGTRPIYVFDEKNEYAPSLLIELIENIEHFPKIIKTEGNMLNSKLNYIETEYKPNYDVNIKNTPNRNKYNVKLESDDEAILVISKNKSGMFLPLHNNIYIKNINGGIEEIKTSKDTCNQLINKKIVLDSEGFYTSFRLLFFKFIAESENKIPLFSRNFQWNDFKSLLCDTFQWLELLRKISFKYEESNKNLVVGPKFKLALDISKLKLYAKDPGYIYKFWLSNPVYIETSKGDIAIYEKEHPKTRNDLITLYKWINDNFEDIELSEMDANRSYSASITLQKIRRDFLRKRKKNIPYAHLDLYYEFEKTIDRVLLNANSFEVSYADVVKINDEITPYKVVNDYKKYLR